MTDVNYTYCGDHFAIHTDTKSLGWTPKTHMLYLHHTSMTNSKENGLLFTGTEESVGYRATGENNPTLNLLI